MTTQSLLDFSPRRAQEAKDDGRAKLEAKHGTFVRELREAAKQHALVFGSVTADEVRRIAEARGLRAPHPNCWGCIFKGSGWRRIGERPSVIVSNHGHRNPVWTWREHA